jgi:hypothetical protein
MRNEYDFSECVANPYAAKCRLDLLAEIFLALFTKSSNELYFFHHYLEGLEQQSSKLKHTPNKCV